METIPWDEKGELGSEVVEQSLAFVRQEGDKAKVKRRRIASATSGTVALVAAFTFVAFNISVSGQNQQRVAKGAATSVVTAPPASELKPLLAADLSQRALTSLRTTRDVRGDYSIVTTAHNDNSGDPVPADTKNGQFVMDDRGDFRETSSNGQGKTQQAFQASSGTETMCSNANYTVDPTGAIGPVSCSVQSGNAATEPDFLNWNASLTALREAASSTNVPLIDTTRDGREAWRMSFSVAPHASVTDVDTIAVFVDKATNFPIGSESYFKGKLTVDIHLTSLQFNTSPADVTIVPPKGAPVKNLPAASYHYVSPADLAKWLGHAVPLPASVPQGFNIAQASYVSTPGPDTFNVCGNEESDYFTVTYRSGLDSFLVSIRNAKGETLGCDPFGYKHESQLSVSNVKLSSGLFSGAPAIVGAYDDGSRLFSIGSKNALSVKGDLTTDELVAVANSIH